MIVFRDPLRRRYQTPLQLKNRRRDLLRLDQTDAEDAAGVLPGCGQGASGGKRRRN